MSMKWGPFLVGLALLAGLFAHPIPAQAAGCGTCPDDLPLFAAVFADNVLSPTGAPGAGEPGARGALAMVMPGPTTVCFGLNVIGVDRVTAVEVRQGSDSVTGPVRLKLQPLPQAGKPSSGCISHVPAQLERDVRGDPEGFYLNVVTSRFPHGAVRGQFFPRPGGSGSSVWPWILAAIAILLAGALGVIAGRRMARRQPAPAATPAAYTA